MLSGIAEKLSAVVATAANVSSDEVCVERSPYADFACNVAFRLAKRDKKPPADIAEDLADKLTLPSGVARVEAVAGYLNFTLEDAVLLSDFLTEIRRKGERFGAGEKKDEKIVLEHTSVNPSGPIHVGRIRNTLIGDSLRRILSFAGFPVETRYYVNDVGKQVAMIAQGKDEITFSDGTLRQQYEHYAEREDYTTLFTYVRANQAYEEDEAFRQKVHTLLQKAESGDREALQFLKEAASFCLAGQKKVFDRLDVFFDVFDYESTYLEDGSVAEVLAKLKASPLAKDVEGGFGLDLADYGLEKRGGATILARSDSTSVYTLRDLCYHLDKARAGDRLITVLGEDHKLQFQELSTILTNFLGFTTPLEAVHFSFVSFGGEKLSTRRGHTAPVDALLDEAEDKAREEIEKRGIGSVEDATAIGHGAVKYHLLKTNPNKNITFRWEDALSFEGESAPYIQYMHARCMSLLAKADVDVDALTSDAEKVSLEPLERSLLLILAGYPDVVFDAACERRPDVLASYLSELAAVYSRFYNECRVLDSEDDVRTRRLLLVDASRHIIKSGLALLGIAAPERM